MAGIIHNVEPQFSHMAVHTPDSDALRQRLAGPGVWLVACFCAAWCDTCAQYRPKFEALSEAFPEHVFVWIDIEAHPDLLGDEDVENFPTLLAQTGGRALFYGVMLPHIEHLDRLLRSLRADGPAIGTKLPDVMKMLAG
jgi:thiol-disulfide isomerase/thioredoxin